MSVSGVLFSVGVCVCDLLIFLHDNVSSMVTSFTLLQGGAADCTARRLPGSHQMFTQLKTGCDLSLKRQDVTTNLICAHTLCREARLTVMLDGYLAPINFLTK